MKQVSYSMTVVKVLLKSIFNFILIRTEQRVPASTARKYTAQWRAQRTKYGHIIC